MASLEKKKVSLFDLLKLLHLNSNSRSSNEIPNAIQWPKITNGVGFPQHGHMP